MRNKTKFIQREYSTILSSKSDYLLVVEVIENVPVASFTIRIPTPITHSPLSPHCKN